MSVTVLDLVQGVLSDMDSDEVNSIEETTESMQAARLVKSVYEEIVDEYDLQSTKGLKVLTGLADVTRPTHMLIPEGVHSIELFEYDCRDDDLDAPLYRRITFLYPEDFIAKVNHFGNGDANIQVVTDFGGGSIQVRNDQHPTFYTTFDNSHVVLDSWNSDATSTLIGSRSRILCIARPDLVLASDTVIELPRNLESLLKAELRVMAFDLFKDGAPITVIRSAMRQRVRADRTKHTIREQRPRDKLPDYGRRV